MRSSTADAAKNDGKGALHRPAFPAGGDAHAEDVGTLSPQFRRALGYAPRVDVLLQQKDKGRRLSVNFEICQTDPVAKRARLAAAHRFEPQASRALFLSVASSYVCSGRRDRAVKTVLPMRRLGMGRLAYQMVLLPHHSGAEVRGLNHLSPEELALEAGYWRGRGNGALPDDNGAGYGAGERRYGLCGERDGSAALTDIFQHTFPTLAER
ncbi:MAG: hypothetical protein R3272_10235 [Candidatus Promineifilaceae bacterium]|nr:hypothetical protein [Candidatus Promineifilaceae bacterium]